jgi:hypothetical protein
VYVLGPDFPGFPVFSRHGHHSPGIDPVDVTAAYAGPAAFHLSAAHQLGCFNGLLYGVEGRLNVDHHPFPQARGWTGPHTGNFESSVFITLAYNCGNLGRTYVEADD